MRESKVQQLSFFVQKSFKKYSSHDKIKIRDSQKANIEGVARRSPLHPNLNFLNSTSALPKAKLKCNRSIECMKENDSNRLEINKHSEHKMSQFFKTLEPRQNLTHPIQIKWEGVDWDCIDQEIGFGECLGQGSFAHVYEGYDKLLKRPVAVKVIDKREIKDKKRKKLVEEEASILFSMHHINIVQPLRLLEDRKRIFMVTELCGSYTLSRFCRKMRDGMLCESEAKFVFKQIISGVLYIHSKGYCHRDLKMTNILMDRAMKVKIIDFGFATKESSRLTMYCGTPSYMAPEIVNKLKYSGQKVDIWALGVVLYKLLTGDYPFGGIYIH